MFYTPPSTVANSTSSHGGGAGKTAGIALGVIGGIVMLLAVLYSIALIRARKRLQLNVSRRQDREVTTFKNLAMNQAIIDTFALTTFKARASELEQTSETDPTSEDEPLKGESGSNYLLSKPMMTRTERDLEEGKKLAEDCSICSEHFADGDEIRILPCSGQHQFHNHCISQWLISFGSSCPLCRADFKIKKVTPADRAAPIQFPPPIHPRA